MEEQTKRSVAASLKELQTQPKRNLPVARIDFLGSGGRVLDHTTYYSEQDFLKSLKEELDSGVPLLVTLYRDHNGKTISRKFLEDLSSLPKALQEVDLPCGNLPKKVLGRGEGR